MAEKPATAEPKRRWWQFSLRTLLIGVALLGVACAYVGREAKIAADRNEMRKRVKSMAEAELCSCYFHVVSGKRTFTPEPGISWVRRLCGDRGVAAIEFYNIMPQDRGVLQSYFPEADLLLDGGNGPKDGYFTLTESQADRPLATPPLPVPPKP